MQLCTALLARFCEELLPELPGCPRTKFVCLLFVLAMPGLLSGGAGSPTTAIVSGDVE